MNRHGDLRRASAAAVICGFGALVVPIPVLSLLLLAPLAFYLTGYTIVEATFARRELERPQAALFSVGASLAVLALATLPLNYAPGGITAASWSLALVAVVLSSALIAGRRRPRTVSSSPPLRNPRLTYATLGTGLVALALAGAAVAAAFVPFSSHDSIGYTQLWILPAPGGNGPGVTVGVSSEEQGPQAYELRVAERGAPPVSRRLDLDPGETRLLRLPVREPAGTRGQVVAALFLAGDIETPYRRVFLGLPLRDER